MYFSRTFQALNFDIQGLLRTFKVSANPVIIAGKEDKRQKNV